MRIVPGDKCTILLDGYLAITGEVITRQVFYNATQHQVEIQGAGNTSKLAQGGVVSKTGEFKNQDIQSIASSIAAPFGVGVVGTAGSYMKFPRVNVTPGASAWETIEPLARATNTVTGETPGGQLQLGTDGGGAVVIEGVNIIEGREIIHSQKAVGSQPEAQNGGGGAGTDFKAMGQAPGNDDSWGADPTFQRQAEVPGVTSGFSAPYLPKQALSEIPAWSKQMMQNRGKMESGVSDQLQIWVTVTTLGWQRNANVPPSGGLWHPGDMVGVNSPMLVMFGKQLQLKAVTFSQDNNSGTRSTLELVNGAAMGGQPQAKD
jgi:prophage tail gpP-like protein